MNRVQELNLELMRAASFNRFDGDYVTSMLTTNPDIWRGAVMTRPDDLICLRDIAAGHWNVDTLFITPVPGKEAALWDLAHTFGADEVDWLGGKVACRLLGSYSRLMEANKRAILRVWWD